MCGRGWPDLRRLIFDKGVAVRSLTATRMPAEARYSLAAANAILRQMRSQIRTINDLLRLIGLMLRPILSIALMTTQNHKHISREPMTDGLFARGIEVPPFYAGQISREAMKLAQAGREIIPMHFGQPTIGPPAAVLDAARRALSSH